MQAEQNKAEKLNKMAALQQICYEQEETIFKLKQQILNMLDQEREDKIESELQHETIRQAQFDRNQGLCAELKAMLTKINGER